MTDRVRPSTGLRGRLCVGTVVVDSGFVSVCAGVVAVSGTLAGYPPGEAWEGRRAAVMVRAGLGPGAYPVVAVTVDGALNGYELVFHLPEADGAAPDDFDREFTRLLATVDPQATLSAAVMGCLHVPDETLSVGDTMRRSRSLVVPAPSVTCTVVRWLTPEDVLVRLGVYADGDPAGGQGPPGSGQRLPPRPSVGVEVPDTTGKRSSGT
jgi:hypothetical protein